MQNGDFYIKVNTTGSLDPILLKVSQGPNDIALCTQVDNVNINLNDYDILADTNAGMPVYIDSVGSAKGILYNANFLQTFKEVRDRLLLTTPAQQRLNNDVQARLNNAQVQQNNVAINDPRRNPAFNNVRRHLQRSERQINKLKIKEQKNKIEFEKKREEKQKKVNAKIKKMAAKQFKSIKNNCPNPVRQNNNQRGG